MGVRVGEHQRKVSTVAGRLALHIEKHRRMGHRIERDDEAFRQRQRHRGLLARGEFHGVERHLRERPLHVLGQVGARTPKDLAHVFGERQRVRIVRGDAPDARIDGERDFGQPIEVRFDVGDAECAEILVLVQRL